jgi:hypothetical protein
MGANYHYHPIIPMTETLANKIKRNKHPKRKNNDLVAAMYAMYRTGKSIRKIADIYRRTHQVVYGMFKSRGYVLRAKPRHDLVIFDGIDFTRMKGGYLRGTVAGKRMMIHHYIWEKYKGKIPADHVIHHFDNDPKNNAIENLELVAKSDMSRKFNPKGNNQFTVV